VREVVNRGEKDLSEQGELVGLREMGRFWNRTAAAGCLEFLN
jgi:hypothetical protein